MGKEFSISHVLPKQSPQFIKFHTFHNFAEEIENPEEVPENEKPDIILEENTGEIIITDVVPENEKPDIILEG